MSRIRARFALARRGEDGFTLIELLVAMGLFTGLIGVLMVATTTMFKDVRRQQGQSDNMDSARLVLQLIDKQVRYANAVNDETLQSDGTRRVEWQQGNTGQRQTCVQWRLLTDGRMQYRTWRPILNTGDTLGTTAWVTRGTHISFAAGDFTNATYAVTNLFTTVAGTAGTNRRQLTVSFVTSNGTPPVRTPSQVTLTALNAKIDATLPPPVPVCQENPA